MVLVILLSGILVSSIFSLNLGSSVYISASEQKVQKTKPIKTSGGLVLGVQVPNSSLTAYKGIPLAKSPVGELR